MKKARYQAIEGLEEQLELISITPEQFGAVADGIVDCAPAINAAITYANSKGGGNIDFSKGDYLIKSGINLTGVSNVSLIAAANWGTHIKCSADFNGQNNDTKNDAIYALNFTGSAGPTGYAHKYIEVSGFIIDCSLMSASGIDVDTNNDGIPDWMPGQPVAYGRSLAGIEIMNVDYAVTKNNVVIGAYGNGIVLATSDPLLVNTSGYKNGIRNPIIEGNIFLDCVRGPLPQYGSADMPDGISGSVIQIGSCHGGRISNNYCLRPGGPFSDTFNCQGLSINDNYIEGGYTGQIGASDLAGLPRHQHIGTIHSDFGLSYSTIKDNTFIDIGGIDLHGSMTNEFFFNGYTRTPGPQHVTIRGNKLLRPQGRVQVGAGAVPASGSTLTHNFSHRQPLKVFFFGGAGLVFTRRRGAGASFEAVSPTSEGLIVLYYGDALTINYTTAPTWAWFLGPNIDLAGIRLLGGSVTDHPGTVTDVEITGNTIVAAGAHGIDCYEAQNNLIADNYIESPGIEPGFSGICLRAQVAQAGGGSQNNKIKDNTFLESRTNFLHSNIRTTDAVYSTGNEIFGNTLAVGTAGAIVLANVSNYIGKNSGPGSYTGWQNGGGQYTAPASGAETAPPGPGDWFAVVSGGTVSAIATGKPGATQSMAIGSGSFLVTHGEVIKITHSSAPAFYWKHAN